jgi:hypothetical protein
VPILLWDASALAQRYAPETGSAAVEALLGAALPSQMVATVIGYAKRFSLLVRKRNGGLISRAAFAVATSALETEILAAPEFRLLPVDDDSFLMGVKFIERHGINSSDAALLASFLRFHGRQWMDTCVLVASDRRFLRAAEAEGLRTLNPEIVPASEVAAVLSNY